MKNLLVVLSFLVAVTGSLVHAQSIPSGQYVDLSGSEDYFVVVKNGRVVASECGRVCPPLSSFKILAFNQAIPAIRVIVPGGRVLSMCLESTAPKWANMSRVAYCNFSRGWTVEQPR